MSGFPVRIVTKEEQEEAERKVKEYSESLTRFAWIVFGFVAFAFLMYLCAALTAALFM